jgi:hypothetical protein
VPISKYAREIGEPYIYTAHLTNPEVPVPQAIDTVLARLLETCKRDMIEHVPLQVWRCIPGKLASLSCKIMEGRNKDLGVKIMPYSGEAIPSVEDVPAPVKCTRVEYDRDYIVDVSSLAGQFAYIPHKVIDACGGDVRKAFRLHTGIDSKHIMHFSEDEVYTLDGTRVSDDFVPGAEPDELEP